jgi:hypothetical protein
VRDDVDWQDSSDEKMADIERNISIARQALQRYNPIFDLPLAEEHFWRHAPQLVESGNPARGAVARHEVIHSTGPFLGAGVVGKSRVTCRRAPGHDGPSVSLFHTELSRLLWQVLTWEDAPSLSG